MRSILCAIFTLVLCAATGAQTAFGTNTGTFAYWLPTDAMTDLPLNPWGSTSAPWTPDTAILGPNGSITGDGGVYTQAENYPSGSYTVSFNSPSPVTINAAGFFSGISNVQRVGTQTTETVTLAHDGGNILDGSGWLTTSGVTTSNPLSNFQIYQTGTTPGALTPTFQGYVDDYQGVRFMNSLNINNNVAAQTSASLVPSGFNMGSNSYADIANWINSSPKLETAMIEIPIGADNSYVAAVAKTMSGVAAGKQIILEFGNEDWNYTFTQAGTLANLGAADPRVTATDSFGQGAQETGILAAQMVKEFDAAYTGKATVNGFLGSQGSNTYFVDQEKNAIANVYGASAVASLFQYQGISFYPGDGLSSDPGSEPALYSYLEGDLARLKGYLKTDATDAASSGLHELIYEWSPNGYLTQGKVSASEIAAFRASPDSKQLTIDTWNAINANIGPGGMAFEFTVTGDSWSTQIDPASSTEQEQLGIDQIAAGLSTPEPNCPLFYLAVFYALIARGRKRRDCVPA